MNRVAIIFKKELFRVFSDRKLMFSLFVLPALIVVIITNLMGKMIGNMVSDIEEHVSEVTIVNAGQDLKDIVSQTGYDKTANINWIDENEYDSTKEELENEVLEGNQDLIVYFEPGFSEKVEKYDNADFAVPEMKVYYNNTENYSSQAYSVYENVVSSNYQTALLTERFGNVGYLTAFNENTELIFKEEKANTEFISMMLPYLIVMMLFAGVMSIGVDAIAGEKERGTLASMLITPVKRSEIVVGKLLSMAVLAGIVAIIYSVAMIFSMGSMSSGMTEEVAASGGFGTVSFSLLQCVELLVTMLVIVYLYVGIVGLLATLAKDTKSAQSTVGPVYIVVVILGVMTMFSSGKEIPFYRYFVPIYGNALAIKDIVSNELTTVNFLCSIAGTVALGVIFTIAITKAFNSEKIMFNA